MSDFTSGFWGPFIAIVTLISVIGCGVFLKVLSTRRLAPGEKPGTTGHVWDEDLAEYHNPMPRWWMWLFYITVVFSLIYLAIFPGLGSFAGVGDWNSQGKYEKEMADADKAYGPLFDKFLKQDLKAVAADAEGKQMGERLYLTYCSQCHGSDARGAKGFPNLTDNDWLYGGDAEIIKASITNGRSGMMPPMAAAVGGGDGTNEVANYVLSLSRRPHDAQLAAAGQAKFAVCAACHGPDGKGNPALGAPNLTDEVWLYGGSEKAIIETITKGRNGQMPAQRDALSEGKIHLLAAYVYGLSAKK
ncbi:MAG: cytochrome-c oxidase, cbb3-type subunit III [Burkholderiales bacterium]|nr:cytochrome-c oxidase, cbb3-type subunit III [Burkholderiales bacterium]